MRAELAKARIPKRLWSIFLPQLEQLRAQVVPTPFGVGGRVALPHIEGWFWGCAVAPDCLVTSMNLIQRQDFVLVEQPQVSYLVIARFTPWDAGLMNNLWSFPSISPLPDENIAAFGMRRGSYDFPMQAGSSHGGCTICMLPSFLERELGAQAPAIRRAMQARLDLNHALELRSVLRAIRPARALRPGAPLFFRAKALEALGEVAALAGGMERKAGPGTANANELSDRVSALLEASLERPPSLDELAGALGISRTTLCARFREQTGTTVGNYLGDLRMSKAKLLLDDSNRTVAQIATAVGYQNPAAFSTAFRRATGLSPRAWRALREGARQG